MLTRLRRWRSAATLITFLTALAAGTAVTPAAASAGTDIEVRELPEPPSAAVVRTELAGLEVAAPHSMTGYSREKFPHWTQQHGECDTREVVLVRDGEDVKQDDKCRAISGTWFSEYDGATFHAAGQLDIDHVVPLANAWRSGADAWTTPQRRAFANDLVHAQLIAVSASSNRAKGDQSPDQWAPPRHAYWCTYSRAWIDVKHVYHLTITAPEKTKLTEMLDNCEQ